MFVSRGQRGQLSVFPKEFPHACVASWGTMLARSSQRSPCVHRAAAMECKQQRRDAQSPQERESLRVCSLLNTHLMHTYDIWVRRLPSSKNIGAPIECRFGQNLDNFLTNVQVLSRFCPIFVQVLSMSNNCQNNLNFTKFCLIFVNILSNIFVNCPRFVWRLLLCPRFLYIW